MTMATKHAPLSALKRRIGFILLAVTILFQQSCGLIDTLKSAIVEMEKIKNVLHDGVITMSNTSGSWQMTLQDLQGKLSADSASLIRNEVSNLLAQGIAETGTEVRCESDYIQQ